MAEKIKETSIKLNDFSYIKHISLNTNSIQQFIIDDDKLTVFSIYIISKIKKHNSIIYNFTDKKISEILGISVFIVKKNIPLMIKMGLCKISGNNLIFISINKLFNNTKRKERIDFKNTDNLIQIKDKIRLLYIQNTLNKQKYAVHIKSEIGQLRSHMNMPKSNKQSNDDYIQDSYYSYKRYKKLNNIAKKYNYVQEKINNTVLTHRNIQMYLNMSLGAISNLMKRTEKQKWIKRKALIYNITKNCPYECFEYSGYNKKNIGYYFWCNNSIYNYQGTDISFNLLLKR